MGILACLPAVNAQRKPAKGMFSWSVRRFANIPDVVLLYDCVGHLNDDKWALRKKADEKWKGDWMVESINCERRGDGTYLVDVRYLPFDGDTRIYQRSNLNVLI